VGDSASGPIVLFCFASRRSGPDHGGHADNPLPHRGGKTFDFGSGPVGTPKPGLSPGGETFPLLGSAPNRSCVSEEKRSSQPENPSTLGPGIVPTHDRDANHPLRGHATELSSTRQLQRSLRHVPIGLTDLAQLRCCR
jgi:hypothetical protein